MTFNIIFFYSTLAWGIFYSMETALLLEVWGYNPICEKPTWLLLLLKIEKLLKKSLGFNCKQNRFSKSLAASLYLILLFVTRLVSKIISHSLSQTDTAQCLQSKKYCKIKDFWEWAGGKSRTTFKLILHIEFVKVLKANWAKPRDDTGSSSQ